MTAPMRMRTRGYLPHYEGGTLIQHVIFRVADALPPEAETAVFDDERARFIAVERWLDAGHGSCPLAQGPAADAVLDTLKFFHGDRYALHAFVVMPSHVHVLIQPLNDHTLSRILFSWKSFTAKRINALLGLSGRVWHREWYDRFIRDAQHYDNTWRYIERNPVAAGLAATAEDWPWSSAHEGWTQ